MTDALLERIVLGGNHELDRRRQAVERDVGVDLGEVLAVVTERVDLEDPHRQLRHVLHSQVEGDQGVGREQRGIGRQKLDVDPVADAR